MTAASAAFWARVNRMVSRQTPDVAAAYLAALSALADRLGTAEMQALIEQGAVDRALSLALDDPGFNIAFARFRAQLQVTVKEAVIYFGKDVPGQTSQAVRATFNYLNPRIVDALQSLEGKVLGPLKADVRETVRAALVQGIQDGDTPGSIARGLRDVIGLGPSQWEQVQNFRTALENADAAKALSYTARDKRFDASITKGTLTPAKIDTLVSNYAAKRVAINAATVARTATLESYKVGQALSWQDAVDMGAIPDGFVLMRTWHHLAGQLNPRPEHEAMDGQTVGFDEPYSNGDSYAGEGDPWNCHCLDEFSIEPLDT